MALTGGICLLTGEKIAPDYGNLETYETFEELEAAFKKQIDYFMDKMLLACEEVEKAHKVALLLQDKKIRYIHLL